MTSISIKGIDEPPTSLDKSTSLAYLASRPSSGPFPSDTANNYYSAIKFVNRSKPKTGAREKKTLSTLIAEALTVSTSPRSPKMDEEPGHIPPVTSFQHDEDALSAGSSITTPTVLKAANRANVVKAHSPGCSVITEGIEEKPMLSPGNTVLSAVTEKAPVNSVPTDTETAGNALRQVALSPGSIKTEKASVVMVAEKALSPASNHMSIKTEKASVMSIATDKASIAPSNMSIKTENAPRVTTKKTAVTSGVAGQKIVGGTPKRSNKARALPPKPVTVKDFATTKGSKSSKLPASLGIPDLSKTEKQTITRAESPATPRISNSSTTIKKNLSFSYPMAKKNDVISSVRSMSPSLERSVQSRMKNTAPELLSKGDNKASNASSVDNIGSAIIITDLLSVTHGVSSPVEQAEVNEEKHTIEMPSFGSGQEVIMSTSMNEKVKKVDDSAQKRPKTTLFKRALSIGSRSVSSVNSKQSVDEIQEIAPSASKDSSKSSKNPASDSSTAASTVSGSNGSISSNENKSQGNFSVAATECTAKMSNIPAKSAIGKSMSFSGPKKEKASIKNVRSMSPSLSKYLSSSRAGQKKDERETIDSVAVKDKSLPPLAPKPQVISSLQAKETKKQADDVSVEVVGLLEGTVDEKGSEDNGKSKGVDSDVKRRQKVKMGRLMRSRQDLRSQQSLSSSPSSSVAGSNILDNACDGEGIPALESVPSDRLSNAQPSTIQKEYTKALEQRGVGSVKSLTDFIAAAGGQLHPFTTEKSANNEMDIYADLNDPVPISQIDFVPDQGSDDVITLDPELSKNKQKFEIWHENEDFDDKPAPKGRYNCGAGGFRRRTDDSSVSDDFLQDDLSYDGKKKKGQTLACGAEELAEEMALEMKYAAKDVYAGVKKASMTAARVLFGVCDITADGGVDYLAKEMDVTQKQLMTGEIPNKGKVKSKSTQSNPRKSEKGMPTAEEALEQATQKKIELKRSAHLKKRYSDPATNVGLTIVERQELARKQREEEDILKKKRHILRLKSLSMKHL